MTFIINLCTIYFGKIDLISKFGRKMSIFLTKIVELCCHCDEKNRWLLLGICKFCLCANFNHIILKKRFFIAKTNLDSEADERIVLFKQSFFDLIQFLNRAFLMRLDILWLRGITGTEKFMLRSHYYILMKILNLSVSSLRIFKPFSSLYFSPNNDSSAFCFHHAMVKAESRRNISMPWWKQDVLSDLSS